MIAKLLIRFAIWIAVMAAVLFGAAGMANWPAGWIYLALMLVSGLGICLWLAKHDPGLLEERLGSIWQKDQEPWDKIVMTIFVALWVAWFVLMAIDAARFRWSQVPVWLQAIGAIGFIVSSYFTWLTFRENSFAAPVVKIQAERKQTVVTTGPYAYVRHPMYAAAILGFLSQPLLLGSWYGLAFVPVLLIALAIRTVKEEQTLTEKLDGYREYAARVHYRFVPGIW